MHDELAQLQRVDHHDRAANKAERAAAKLRGRRADAEKAVADAEARLEELAAIADRRRKVELETHRELEQARTYRQRAMRALEQGLGDAEAAQRQLEATSEQIDDLETRSLEIMEEGDAHDQAVAVATDALKGVEGALATLMETFEEELGQHLSVASDAHAAVAREAEGLPKDLKDRYDAFRAKGLWAVSHIREGACNACNKVVTQQHITDLRRGLLKPCLGCHRFLVVVDPPSS